MTWVWLDHRLVQAADARINVVDRGLTVGHGVFETMKVVEQVPFALDRHLIRLQRSADAVGIAGPPEDDLRRAIAETAAANAGEVGEFGRMRLTLTAGDGELGDPYAAAGHPRLIITVVPQRPWPPTSRVLLSTYRRNEYSALTGVKSTSYAENAVALREAKSADCDEALLLNTAGDVCEGTGSNIVLVIDATAVTPPLNAGCLAGVTRELAIEWCGVVEARLTRADLDRATEAFLTSSTRDLHPITELAGRELPAPGPVTQRAMQAWADRVALATPGRLAAV